MDGGGRLLRSLGGLGDMLARVRSVAPAPAFAGPFDPHAFPIPARAAPRLPGRRRRHGRFWRRAVEIAVASRFLGSVLVLTLLAGAAFYGAVRGGAYAEFAAANGTIPDIVGRLAGFPIKAVTITGTHELSEAEILNLAGIGPHNSLVFLDVAAIRGRLKAVPLIKEASVTKLFPDRLLVELEERQPYALWQHNGQVSIVAADGTPIDDLHNARYTRLPLVVGDGANGKLPEYHNH